MTTETLAEAPRVLQIDLWPATDRALWEAGLLPGNILDGRAYASGLRAATIRNSARGYGRWLAFLQAEDPSALLLHAPERVTPARARGYLGAMQAVGNTNNTIKARFWELRSALRIIAPDYNFRWINYPAGASLHALLPTQLNPIDIMDIHDLTQWGLDLMAEALTLPDPLRRALMYRNGLIVAIMANRAPRIRSMSALRDGSGIVRSGDCYHLSFTVAQTKGRRRLGYDLNPALTPHVAHYIDIERPVLLGGQSHDWLWVGVRGEPLGIIGFDAMFRRGSMARFGRTISAHRFRHALATASVIANPKTPALIAAVLGNSPAVVMAHYVMGGQIEAGESYQDTLEANRAQTAARARHKQW